MTTAQAVGVQLLVTWCPEMVQSPRAPPAACASLPICSPHPTMAEKSSDWEFNFAGRKRALLVGITYAGTRRALRGPLNDVSMLYDFLVNERDFLPKNVAMLVDGTPEISNPHTKPNCFPPNRATILSMLNTLVTTARPGDSLWFSYSGHGDQRWDESGDEADGFDEAIVPVDHATAGIILDDELFAIVRKLPRGSRLNVLVDCCHSATILDLPYLYHLGAHRNVHVEYDGGNPTPNAFAIARTLAARPFAKAMCGGATGYEVGGVAGGMLGGVIGGVCGVVRDVPNVLSAARLVVTGGGREEEKRDCTPIGGEVLCLSGTQDYFPSQDHLHEELGVWCGRLTYSFLKVVRSGDVKTYRDMLFGTRYQLRKVRFMTPAFSSGRPFDIDTPFFV